MGKYAEAEALYANALKGRERSLGPEHPHTLNTVSNLAGIVQYYCSTLYDFTTFRLSSYSTISSSKKHLLVYKLNYPFEHFV